MRESQSLFATIRRTHTETFLAQETSHDVALRRVVVYHEHAGAGLRSGISAAIESRYYGCGVCRNSVHGKLMLRLVNDCGQLDSERAAFAGNAVDCNVAAHHLTEPARECQPKTGTAELARRRRISLSEILEQLDDFLGGKTDAGVADAEHDPFRIVHHFPLSGEPDGSIVRELGGVRQQ